MDSSSPAKVLDASNGAAGVKRPALLPPFEPEASPRFKRLKGESTSNGEKSEKRARYPTPIPSSSMGFCSSPPNAPCARRPLLARSQSTLSERSPLSALPSIALPENGEPILLGRSSGSCHYQLSASRLISRVHVKASYVNSPFRSKVEIECLGWNGIKIHCQGHSWQLERGDIFTSEIEDAEIMLDIQETRVLIAWPEITESESREATPRPRVSRSRSPSVDWLEENDENVDPRAAGIRLTRISRNKISSRCDSPTPKRESGNPMILPSESGLATDTLLEIYEDESTEDYDEPQLPEPPSSFERDADSKAKVKLLLDSEQVDEDSDGEDNNLSDPILQSFDPIAQNFDGSEPNLPPMATFSTAEDLGRSSTPVASSPNRRRVQSSPGVQTRSVSLSPNKANTIQNHITNQLAFSRLSSTQLSTLYANIPATLLGTLSKERLAVILSEIECVGEVIRTGKDAAGKKLESQYYYIPDKDDDESRRAAVVEGMGRVGLRACRKTHKQYYWKKPKKLSH
ncbi:target of SBF [Rhizina undulata]